MLIVKIYPTQSQEEANSLINNDMYFNTLDCTGCTKLTSLPSGMINLRVLVCKKCTSLTTLPVDLVNLRVLDCDSCTRLSSVPESMPNLRCLSCKRCPSLTWDKFIYMPKLEKLFCDGEDLEDFKKYMNMMSVRLVLSRSDALEGVDVESEGFPISALISKYL